MNISLTEDDLWQMPHLLRASILRWQMSKISAVGQTNVRRGFPEVKETANQLSLQLESENQVPQSERNHVHVTLTQLYDAGITKRGMAIRVKLKQEQARQLCRNYINSLEISNRGTVICDGEEFNKLSPLAKKVNGSPVNGWDYVEAKVNEQWVPLEHLRQIWRQSRRTN